MPASCARGRVAVAMSGGVDSSTVAALLVEAGHEVVGLTLQLWDHSAENLASGRGRCCSPADVADARSVAAELGIRHYVFDHSAGFRRQIVEPFVEDYAHGLTPSPCIRCNRNIKFEVLWRLARGLEAEGLATGHYARLFSNGGRPQLRKARDDDKDQSYFLFDVPAARFAGVRFPLGELSKEDVRTTARRLDLPVADKPESYELCFIPDGNKDRFVEERLDGQSASDASPALRGAIRHVDGRTLGCHPGLHLFTIGQRKGLGVHSTEPMYVLGLEADTATVTVGPAAALETDGLVANTCNWVSISEPQEPIKAAARIRHRHREVESLVEPLGDGRVRVRFSTPQRAVAPGQGVAFYRGDLLLGGGWIESAL